jgi:hypothetical protein
LPIVGIVALVEWMAREREPKPRHYEREVAAAVTALQQVVPDANVALLQKQVKDLTALVLKFESTPKADVIEMPAPRMSGFNRARTA